jgi:hypothetical protein
MFKHVLRSVPPKRLFSLQHSRQFTQVHSHKPSRVGFNFGKVSVQPHTPLGGLLDPLWQMHTLPLALGMPPQPVNDAVPQGVQPHTPLGGLLDPLWQMHTLPVALGMPQRVNDAVPQSVQPVAPPGRPLKYGPGTHGAKKSEQKRLLAKFNSLVTGDSHESEHTIGFEPLNQTTGLERGTTGRASELEKKAPAYQEVKKLHRAHIGTGTNGIVDKSGFNSQTYREAQRSLMEVGDISSAAQINQLGYAHMTNVLGNRMFGDLPDTLSGRVANDSFNHMVSHMNTVTYAQGADNVNVNVDARQRAEMHLSRIAAQSGKFPSVAEENAVRKLYGLEEYKEK